MPCTPFSDGLVAALRLLPFVSDSAASLLLSPLRLFNVSDHVKRALGIILELIPQNSLTPIESAFEAHDFSLDSAKLLGGEKGLREKTLKSPRPSNDIPILGRKLFEPKHGDDVFELFILCERPSDFVSQSDNAVLPRCPA